MPQFSDPEWFSSYETLIAYRRSHPGTWPADDAEFPTGNPLGVWVVEQRSAHATNSMDPKKSALLESIDFSWMTEDDKWTLQFSILEEFLSTNQNTWPTIEDQFPQGNFLGEWCAIQRQRKKKGTLPSEKVARLDSVNINWPI